MSSKFNFFSLVLLLCTAVPVFANETNASLARRAASRNEAESSPAIEELRSLGPAGMDTLMKQYAAEIEAHIAQPTTTPSADWLRISAALDAVSQQKNSYLSGLYWYTDLNDARRASAQSGKPILSLRLLGKLTDELSCANSRFFRTVLYSNAEVSAVLRDKFVLHWQSVRPVPVVTIDFGDGRKIERTVTGNSIHYILDAAGQPIEAIPGLYGPKAFLRGLTEAETLFQSLPGPAEAEKVFWSFSGKTETAKQLALNKYYSERLNRISLDWMNDTTRIGGKPPAGFIVEKDANGAAVRIAPLAATKMVTEVTVLREMAASTEALGQITDEAGWRKIAQLHAADAQLDERSIALIKNQYQSSSEAEMSKLLRNFQALVALDTVRNEYMLRSKLYVWLMRAPSRKEIDKFNEKVYAELFLTPQSDPWLGLLLPDTYTAIDNGGVIKRRNR